MHVKISKSNFQAQKKRTLNSIERIQGPCPPLYTPTEAPRTGNIRPLGFHHAAFQYQVALKAVEKWSHQHGNIQLSFTLALFTMSHWYLRCSSALLSGLSEKSWYSTGALGLGWICSLKKVLTASWTAIFFLTWGQVKWIHISDHWFVVRFLRSSQTSTRASNYLTLPSRYL